MVLVCGQFIIHCLCIIAVDQRPTYNGCSWTIERKVIHSMLMISCESAALIFIKSKIFSILRFPHEVRGFYCERLILRESVSQSRSDTRTFRLTTSHSGNHLLLTVTDSRSKMISRVSCGGSRPCMSPSVPPTSCWSSGSRECADWRHSRACYPPPPARGQQRRS